MIEIQKYFKTYKLSNDLIVKVQIIDIPGYKQFRDIYELSFGKANSIILVYDITNKYSFDECKNYFSLKIKEKCKDNVKVILLGNKSDLENDRVVSYEEAKNFADLNNYIFTEISCLKNENIFELFQELIGLTVIKNKNINSKIKQNDIKNENEKNNLCYII